MKLKNIMPIRQIKAFFCLMSLASRRISELSTIAKDYYKTKKELISTISSAIGDDWKNISEIQIESGRIKIVRYYRKR